MICISTRSPATVVSWMKDGVIIDESSTDYTVTQTITDRASSTYSNILAVSVGVSGGVHGRYICTVSNDLGSDSEVVVVMSELDFPMLLKHLDFFFLTIIVDLFFYQTSINAKLGMESVD